MKAKIHAAAGAAALFVVGSFWLATVTTELSGNLEAVAAVKAGILAGMAVLVPLMVIAGASGFSLAKGWRSPSVARKKRRMRIVAANGVLVLVPAAYVLAGWAGEGRFDTAFYALQGLELVAGATNIGLLSLNMRDGLALRRKPSRIAAG